MSVLPRVRADALRLVAVTDSLRDGVDGLARRAAAAVAGGATMLTLRLPGESPRVLAAAARALRAAVPGIPLLVSDRVDVALAVDADGVHLGSNDLSAAAVRRFAPEGLVIGVSVGSAQEVGRAEGADFVAIGPVYAASLAVSDAGSERVAIGVERFAELVTECGLAAVAVGGVSTANASALMAAGASGVAVISALLGADDPTVVARALRSVLDASGR
jgi:thiamine-phosphate pyrophosphorylase